MQYLNAKLIKAVASALVLTFGLAACNSKEAHRPRHKGALSIGSSGGQNLSALLESAATVSGSRLTLIEKSGIASIPYKSLSLRQIREQRFEISAKIETIKAKPTLALLNSASSGTNSESDAASSESDEANPDDNYDDLVAAREENRRGLITMLRTTAPYILKQRFISNRRSASSREMGDAYHLFNQALNVMVTEYPEDSATLFYLNQLEAQIFRYCDAELKGCTNADFYLSDNMAVKLMTAMADNQERRLLAAKAQFHATSQTISDFTSIKNANPSECTYEYTIVRTRKKIRKDCISARKDAQDQYFAETNAYFNYFLLGNRGLNGSQYLDYYLKYIRYTKDYALWFQSLSATEKEKRAAEYRTRQNFLGDALRLLKSANSAEYCDYLIDAKPYAYYTGGEEENPNLNLIIKDFISCADQRKNLETLISNYVRDEEPRIQKEAQIELAKISQLTNTELIAVRDLSYVYALDFISTKPHIMKNLGIQNITRSDLAYYIIDGIFYERLDMDLAREYFNRMEGITPMEFMQFMDNYVKVQIAYLLRTTQMNLGRSIRFFYKKYNSLTGDLFQDVADDLHTSTDSEWRIMKKRISFLNDFLIQAYNSKYGQGARNDEEKKVAEYYKKLKTQLSTEKLNSHIDYLVTTPLMLAMSYYMAKSENNIVVTFAWMPGQDQTLSIDSSNALSTFFNPRSKMILFFRYGSDWFRMDDFQKQQSFDLAFRSGLFEFIPFDIRKEDQQMLAKLKAKYPHLVNADHPELANEYLFFERLFHDVLKFFKGSFRDQITDLDKLLQVQDHVGRFSAACKNPYTTPMDFSVDKLYSNTLVGDDSFLDHMTKVYGRLGYFRYWQQEIRYVRDLMKIAYRHLDSEKYELSPEKEAVKNSIKSTINNELEEYYDLTRQVMRRIIDIDKMIVSQERDCLERIRKAEDHRKKILYDANLDYYRDAHAAISLLSVAPQSGKIEVTPLAEPLDVLNAGRALLETKVNEWYAAAIDGKDQAYIDEHGFADAKSRMLDITHVLFNADITQNPAVTIFHKEELKADNFTPWLRNALSAFIGIHNHQEIMTTLPGGLQKELGFFVTGTDLYSYDKREIKRKNKIYPDRFVQSRWDTLVRIRRQLQTLDMDAAEADFSADLISEAEYEARRTSNQRVPIAPDLYIPMLTIDELANDHLYKDTASNEVYYPENASQTAFLKEAMGQFAGDEREGIQYVSWHSPSGSDLKYIPKRLSYLIRMFQLGSIEITQGERSLCPLDEFGYRTMKGAEPGCEIFAVKAKDVVDYFIKFADFFRLDENDIEILNWINREGRLHQYVGRQFKLEDKEDSQDWTFFDKFFQRNFTRTWAVVRRGSKLEYVEKDRLDGSAFFASVFRGSIKDNFKPEHHLFELNDSVLQTQRDRVRRPILQHLRRAESIEEHIMDLEDSKTDLGQIVFQRKDKNSPDSSFYDFDNKRFVEADVNSDGLERPSLWRYVPIKTRKEGNQESRLDSFLYLRDDPESVKAGFYNKARSFFVAESACEALPTENDPDFKQLQASTQTTLKDADQDCDVRYEAWKLDSDLRRARERNARRTETVRAAERSEE